MLNNLTTVKKDYLAKNKKKPEEFRQVRGELEQMSLNSKSEVNQMQEKLQRLAAQFDKELMARDKQMKQFKNMSQEDVQRSFATLSTDIEMTRK